MLKIAPLPANEPERLRALYRYAVLDTLAEPGFDALAQLAAHIAGTPVSLVSLIDCERQWFKAKQGLDIAESPRHLAFCNYVVFDGAAVIIPDTRLDPRVADNPFVTLPPHFLSYAGFPLTSPDGYTVGTLCVLDYQPRQLTAEQLQMLGLLATQVMAQLELRRHNLQLAQQAAKLEIFQQFFDLTLDLLATTNEHLHFDALNPAWEKVLGWTLDELRAVPFSHFVHPDDLERTAFEASRLVDGSGTVINFENRYRHKSGHWVLLSWVAAARGGVLFASARDISTYREQQEALQQALQQASEVSSRLRSILGSANYSIVETAPDGTIREFNAAAERMLGHSAADLIGRATPEILHDREEVAARARELAAETGGPLLSGFEVFVHKARSGSPDEREWTYIRKDGSRFPVELSITTRRSEAGEVVGFLGIASDISERRRVERLQSEFVSTVSHELRTPLTSIRGALGLVASGVTGPLAKETQEYIDIALINTERLVRLINDILDIEKIQSGTLQLRQVQLELADAVRQAITANATFAATLQVPLLLTEPAAKGEVQVEPDSLAQVLANLLSNAAKFSPAGQPVVVSVVRRGSWLRVQVSDRGPGLPEAFRKRIFQRFAQADGSSTRAQSGTGLGLAISKALVEQMHGRIGFDSTEGQGSTFYCEFPSYLAPEPIPPPAQVSSGPRLLHVEDDENIRRLIRRTLPAGWTVVEAADAELAAKALLDSHFDLLLLDLALPGDGAEGLLDLAGTAKVVIFSALRAPPELAGRVDLALVKSRSHPADVCAALIDLVGATAAAAAEASP